MLDLLKNPPTPWGQQASEILLLPPPPLLPRGSENVHTPTHTGSELPQASGPRPAPKFRDLRKKMGPRALQRALPCVFLCTHAQLLHGVYDIYNEFTIFMRSLLYFVRFLLECYWIFISIGDAL